jgi:oxygen-independent coproporphyrinogen-3 oxidase
MLTTAETSNVYIHLPFCEAKCHYCDFFSLAEEKVSAAERGRIHDSILRELDHYGPRLTRPLDTVFLGGGTPSLAPPEVIAALLARLPFDQATEITMEANPSSVTFERARRWRESGITRVSMGVQALNDGRLKWLGRVHSASEVFDALSALFEAGIANISIDYIVGVPAQATSDIERELVDVLSRFQGIRHVSAYLLTLKEASALYAELPDEDEQLRHLRAVSETLRGHGFEQYEISNFAKPGARARHNENYWTGGGYAGIGPSAHSFWPAESRRAKNWSNLRKYSEAVARDGHSVEWSETLSPEQMRLEYLMLRLRRSEGLNVEAYRSAFGRDLDAEKGGTLRKLEEMGLIDFQRGAGFLKLTTDGFFLSDQIVRNIS